MTTEMFETMFGEQPVIGMITDCKMTDFGWTGVLPDGRTYERRDPYARKPGELPGGYVTVVDRTGKPLGVLFVENHDAVVEWSNGERTAEHKWNARTKKHERRKRAAK